MTAGVASTKAGVFVQRLACGAAKARRRRHQARELPEELCDRFAGERAPGVRAVIEFHVETEEAHVERFQLLLQEGDCRRARRLRRATTSIAITLEDLFALLDGRVAASSLFMSQRMTVRGDVLMAARLPHFFLP